MNVCELVCGHIRPSTEETFLLSEPSLSHTHSAVQWRWQGCYSSSSPCEALIPKKGLLILLRCESADADTALTLTMVRLQSKTAPEPDENRRNTRSGGTNPKPANGRKKKGRQPPPPDPDDEDSKLMVVTDEEEVDPKPKRTRKRRKAPQFRESFVNSSDSSDAAAAASSSGQAVITLSSETFRRWAGLRDDLGLDQDDDGFARYLMDVLDNQKK